ncbi:MAG TPA: hypothetical protein VGR78_02005 [Verrucomicrobiae bacterium]|jgi:hypothetical protein|nr:hypothetical protein [Verrucomicrobiae bacterium]
MKTKNFLSRITITIALATVFAPRTQAGFIGLLRGDPAAPPVYQRVAFVGTAKVKQVEGAALRLEGIDSWIALTKGTLLKPGDVVRSEGGKITLQMTESQSLVRISPHTILRLMPFDNTSAYGVLSGCDEKNGFVVRGCRGRAEYRLGPEDWRPVKVNDILAEGCVLRTEARSTVDLYATEARSAVRIPAGTQIGLTKSLTGHIAPQSVLAVR